MQLRIYPVALRAVEQLGVVARHVAREDRDLARQLRRASSSVLLNLAEGESVARGNKRLRYETARGSASECVACLDCAVALGYVESGGLDDVREALDHVGRTLTKLIRR